MKTSITLMLVIVFKFLTAFTTSHKKENSNTDTAANCY